MNHELTGHAALFPFLERLKFICQLSHSTGRSRLLDHSGQHRSPRYNGHRERTAPKLTASTAPQALQNNRHYLLPRVWLHSTMAILSRCDRKWLLAEKLEMPCFEVEAEPVGASTPLACIQTS